MVEIGRRAILGMVGAAGLSGLTAAAIALTEGGGDRRDPATPTREGATPSPTPGDPTPPYVAWVPAPSEIFTWKGDVAVGYLPFDEVLAHRDALPERTATAFVERRRSIAEDAAVAPETVAGAVGMHPTGEGYGARVLLGSFDPDAIGRAIREGALRNRPLPDQGAHEGFRLYYDKGIGPAVAVGERAVVRSLGIAPEGRTVKRVVDARTGSAKRYHGTDPAVDLASRTVENHELIRNLPPGKSEFGRYDRGSHERTGIGITVGPETTTVELAVVFASDTTPDPKVVWNDLTRVMKETYGFRTGTDGRVVRLVGSVPTDRFSDFRFGTY